MQFFLKPFPSTPCNLAGVLKMKPKVPEVPPNHVFPKSITFLSPLSLSPKGIKNWTACSWNYLSSWLLLTNSSFFIGSYSISSTLVFWKYIPLNLGSLSTPFSRWSLPLSSKIHKPFSQEGHILTQHRVLYNSVKHNIWAWTQLGGLCKQKLHHGWDFLTQASGPCWQHQQAKL